MAAAPDRIKKMAAEMKRIEETQQKLLADGTYRDAQYRIACSTCGASLSSEESDPLLPLQSKAIDAADADMFLERWTPLLMDDQPGTWRLMSPVMSPEEPFIHLLRTFIAAHRNHVMDVELSSPE